MGVLVARTDSGAYRVGFGAEGLPEATVGGQPRRGQLATYDRILTNRYQAIRAVDVPPNAEEFARDLPVDPGGSILIRLVDEAGRPVPDVAIPAGRYPSGGESGSQSLGDHTETRITGMEPGVARVVVCRQADRKLGAVVTLPPADPKVGDRDVPGGRVDPAVTVSLTPITSVVLKPVATVVGRVVDAAGKPASGRIELVMDQLGVVPNLFRIIRLGDAMLDAEGRFRIADVPAGGTYNLRVLLRFEAGRPGESLGIGNFGIPVTPEPGATHDLGTVDAATGKPVAPAAPAPAPEPKKEAATMPINGRIVDRQGRPVAGVQVKAGGYRTFKAGGLTAWLDATRGGKPPWIAAVGAEAEGHEQAPEAARRGTTTNADGRFRLDGYPAEAVVDLKIEGERVAYAEVDVATRRMEPVPAPGVANQFGPGTMTILGADFTLVATPSRPILGVVRDAQTGAALAGVEVRSYRFAGSNFVGTMVNRTTADDQGRFRLDGMPAGAGNKLLIVPTDEQPYPMQEAAVPDATGDEVATVEVALARGIWIVGKITDADTGRPVGGARLAYLPFLDNPFARANPVFDTNGNAAAAGFQDRYLSRADGTFRLVGLPGRAIVGAIQPEERRYLAGDGAGTIAGIDAQGMFPTFSNPIPPGKLWPTAMREINPPAGLEIVRLDLEFRTGPSVRLRVADAAGAPVGGAMTRGLGGRSSYERDPLPGAEATARNLRPDEARHVLIWHKERRIGKVAQVRAGDDSGGPVAVTLEPLASLTGAVVDATGRPAPGARVRADVAPGGGFSLALPEVLADPRGRFVVPAVPVGGEYGLMVEIGQAGDDYHYGALGGDNPAAVRAGMATDVGAIHLFDGKGHP